ncbi:MAG: tRNA (5-methylaminomethyl-2-thiouridine)(34)-methyltransferase MnmD [Microbacter sp.]
MRSYILQTTEDGSNTLFLPELNEHFHSTHGAIQESNHVFLQAGLHALSLDEWHVFEVGFGTGLNALLTAFEATKAQKRCFYTTIELFPLTPAETDQLNYAVCLSDTSLIFNKIHQASWDQAVDITPYFQLHKIHADFTRFNLPTNAFSLIYFDAFAPDKQSEMWSKDLFTNLYDSLKPNGVLVTYSAKGSIRRMMQDIGFAVERLPGPPGKHEMLRGRKTIGLR